MKHILARACEAHCRGWRIMGCSSQIDLSAVGLLIDRTTSAVAPESGYPRAQRYRVCNSYSTRGHKATAINH